MNGLRAELAAARRTAAASSALSAAALLLACCALVASMPRGPLQNWYLVRETPPLKHLVPDQHYVNLQELAIYQARSADHQLPFVRIARRLAKRAAPSSSVPHIAPAG